jgi:muramoyltetrapeptide carboxypeptidase
MVQPAYLKQGDKVAIIATARKISREELQKAVTFLESYGLSVVFGKHLFAIDNQYAGTDAQRAEDLQWALDDAEIKAVFIARGGYGTVRLIDSVNFNGFLKQPKWLVGYSDITVLHNAIHKQDVETLHATVPINFYKDEEATRSMMQALMGGLKYTSASPHPLNRKGKASGEMVGGNLSLIYSLSGTKYDIDTAGKILFIEDLDEYLYHIDRMMMQLKLSGKLENLAGLVVGGMTDMKDNIVPFGKMAEEIILDAVKDYSFPVCFHFPAGHIDHNMALYLGRKTKLEVHADSVSLSYE